MATKHKHLLLLLQLLIFLILRILSVTVLKEVYLVEWMAHNSSITIWIPFAVVMLTLLSKLGIALSLTIGNIIGLIVGQLLGDHMYNENMMKITADMTAEQVHHLQTHYGVFIWLVTLIISLVSGIIFQQFLKKRHNEYS